MGHEEVPDAQGTPNKSNPRDFQSDDRLIDAELLTGPPPNRQEKKQREIARLVSDSQASEINTDHGLRIFRAG